jgi:protein-tyrosine phosphatase
MIKEAVVTNCIDATIAKSAFELQGKNVCWITISDPNAKQIRGSSKHVLVSKFYDRNVDPISPRQIRRIKNFIFNHHLNSKLEWILLINCFAGISRSAAIGMFCRQNLDIPVDFFEKISPNKKIMELFGVKNIPAQTIAGFRNMV